jgi:hypothetical protein
MCKASQVYGYASSAENHELAISDALMCVRAGE